MSEFIIFFTLQKNSLHFMKLYFYLFIFIIVSSENLVIIFLKNLINPNRNFNELLNENRNQRE